MLSLLGCKGYVTSERPLLSPQAADLPLASGTAITGWTLGDDKVWETDMHEARLVVVDGAYKVVEPDHAGSDSDSFLVKRTGKGEFVVQASNGNELAYGLIVHADMYYVFTFNRGETNCTKLTPEERRALRVTVREDRCYVSDFRELVELLRYLRRKFPNPTSAFRVADRPRMAQP